MAEVNNSGGLPVGGGIAVLIAMVAGYFVVSPPNLNGSRPEGLTGKYTETVQYGEDVRARLWEDPFAAVLASQGGDTEKVSLTIKDRSRTRNKAIEINVPAKLRLQEKSEGHSLLQLMGQIISLENDRLLRDDESKYATEIGRVKKTFVQLSKMSDQKRDTLQKSINALFKQRKSEEEQVSADEKKLKNIRKKLNETNSQSQTSQKKINQEKKEWEKAKGIYKKKESKYHDAVKTFKEKEQDLSTKQISLEQAQADVYKVRKKIDSLLFDIQGLEQRKEDKEEQIKSLEPSAEKSEEEQRKNIAAKKNLIDAMESKKIVLKTKNELRQKIEEDTFEIKEKLPNIRKLVVEAEKFKNEASKNLNEAKKKQLQAEQGWLLANANNNTIKNKKQMLTEKIDNELKLLEDRRQSIAAYTEKFESAATHRNAARDVIRNAKDIAFRLESRDPFVINDVFHGKYSKLIRSDSKGISNEFLLELGRILNSRSAYPEQVGNVKNSIEDKGNQKIVSLMLAMVPGGPYAEDIENRLRSRYAIVSALASSGYRPRDPTHIGYLRNNIWSFFPQVIPYEWYEYKDRESDKYPVLLMWLNDSFFRKNLIANMQAIVSTINSGITDQVARDGKTISNAIIIGPASSDTLLAMEKRAKLEVVINPESKSECEPEMFSIFSPIASAHTLKLNSFKKRLCENKISFVRTILSDYRLTGGLVRELEKRIPDFKSKNVKVALISEWDTSYGRALPNAFSESLCKDRGSDCKKRIYRFTYMRGIDGKIPDNDSDKRDALNGSQSSENKEEDRAIYVELPVGKSQVDYLRRMADWIGSMDDIKAIGVLGSDVFDKLLIIKALRERFPKAIFFTTDLDASLLHPENINWTRNLIVASSYGLSLKINDKLLGDKQIEKATVPPFRSVYQTSTYLSVLLALGANNHPKQSIVEKWIEDTQARIYEVGRNGAVELGTLDGSKVIEGENEAGGASITLWVYEIALVLTLLVFSVWYNRWRLLNARHGKKSDQSFANHFCEVMTSPHTHAISLTLVLAIAGIFAISCSIILLLELYLVQVILMYCIAKKVYGENRTLCSRAMNGDESCAISDGQLSCQENMSPYSTCPSYYPTLLKPKALAAYLALVMAVAVLAWMVAVSDEPFSVVDGVSIWPTEILRWLAACIGIILLCRGWQASKWNIQQVGDAFGFGQTKTIFETEPDNSILQIWRTYVINGTGWKRLWRISPVWIAYFVLCNIIILYDKPFVPYRGWGFPLIDRVSIMFAVFVYTFMIFAIVDAIMLCRNFINQLIRIDTVWPFMQGELKIDNIYERVDVVCRREWSEIKLIARRTEVISRLVYYPIIVALILIASRSSYFDHWSTPPGLALVIGFSVFLVICCAISLRKKAVQAEENALAILDREKEKLLGAGHKLTCELIEQIDFYSGRIRDIKSGAFLPITEQPWVQAISLLLGGGGTLILFDVLSLAK